MEEARTKGRTDCEGWRVRHDGSRFWGSMTLTALHHPDGSLRGYLKIMRDLTERKRAEDNYSNFTEEVKLKNEELRKSEERYHNMIEEVMDYAIILLDKDGKVLDWNKGAEKLKGYTSKEIIGKTFRLFYPKDEKEAGVPDLLLVEASEKGSITHEGWRIRKDGTRFWGNVTLTALHDANGEIIGFSKVTRDLTEKKRAEEKLKANVAQLDLKNKTLERLNEELSSFTRVASHDLKEPLRKIQTFVSRIEDAKFDPDKSRDFVAKIRSTAAGMQNLIEDLLSYSQVSSDLNTLTFERTDLNMILADALTDLEVSIHESKAVIDSEPLPSVRGIPYQLRQLFLNLLSNSIKFSKPGRPPHIVIKKELIKGPDIPGQVLDGGNKYHHISIADNGIGFPQHHSDKIFEAFQRLHPRSVFAGSGIGLAIVKKVMENHNGIVIADSVPDAGATFHLYFPTGA